MTGLPWPRDFDDEIRHLVTERNWTPAMIGKQLGLHPVSVAAHSSHKGYQRRINNKIQGRYTDWRYIWMLYQEGCELAEIARMTGLHYSSVESAIRNMQAMTDAHRDMVLQFRDDWHKVMHG
jgi:lambda repressor-like predicted transcriptional regulator